MTFLLADALIRSQFVRFELSILLSYKEFRLGHEMPSQWRCGNL